MDSSCFEKAQIMIPLAIDDLHEYIKSENTSPEVITTNYIVCGFEEYCIVTKFGIDKYRVTRQLRYHSHAIGRDKIDEQFIFNFYISKNKIEELYILKKFNEKLIFDEIDITHFKVKRKDFITFEIRMKNSDIINKEQVLTTVN